VVDGPAAERARLGFGGLLRRLRDEAGLTQDELAEAAAVSQRAISDLERGVNATARNRHRHLAGRGARAGRAGPRAVRRRGPRAGAGRGGAGGRGGRGGDGAGVGGGGQPDAAAGYRGLHRPGRGAGAADGRAGRCRGPVAGWWGSARSRGMAGIGKTTLAVHAAHRLAGRFPDGQIFLPLHGHTPGQRPVDPADALASLLLAAGVAAQAIRPGLDARAGLWRDFLAGKKILLVLDDAAGHEQVGPLLPGTAGCLVLITSRRRLAALDDAAVLSLDTLPPGEAAVLLGPPRGPPGPGPRRCGGGGDHPAVRVPAAGDRDAGPAAGPSPGLDRRGPGRRPGRRRRPAGADGGREPVGGRRV